MASLIIPQKFLDHMAEQNVGIFLIRYDSGITENPWTARATVDDDEHESAEIVSAHGPTPTIAFGELLKELDLQDKEISYGIPQAPLPPGPPAEA